MYPAPPLAAAQANMAAQRRVPAPTTYAPLQAQPRVTAGLQPLLVHTLQHPNAAGSFGHGQNQPMLGQ
jgi:hypothetical protein